MTNQGGGKEAKITEWESIYQKGLPEKACLWVASDTEITYIWGFWKATSPGRNYLFRAGVPEAQPMGQSADHKALPCSPLLELVDTAAANGHRAIAIKESLSTVLVPRFTSRDSRRQCPRKSHPTRFWTAPQLYNQDLYAPPVTPISSLGRQKLLHRTFPGVFMPFGKKIEFLSLQGQKKKSSPFLTCTQKSGLRNFTSQLTSMIFSWLIKF